MQTLIEDMDSEKKDKNNGISWATPMQLSPPDSFEKGGGRKKNKLKNCKKKTVMVPMPPGRQNPSGRGLGNMTMKGDKIISYTTEKGIAYHPGDSVYIQNNRPDRPYFVCSIQEFRLTKRDILVARVKWYYRLNEVPDAVYQKLLQDRHDQGNILLSDLDDYGKILAKFSVDTEQGSYLAIHNT
ncbi:hypothetical protein ACJMK2_007537 [Sinanodonta woodiana]|uniref:BAH domain-containing protein n=1 Tax=Sinanodonta woodiana TaxID=1069815 RepID=A0ABD3VLU1_SINWO